MDMAKIRKKAAQAGSGAEPRIKAEPKKPPADDAAETGAAVGEDPAAGQGSAVGRGETDSQATPEDSPAEVREPEIVLLCFRLGSETHAFRLRDVQEIAHPPAVTPVPGTPPYVRGLSSLRGKMLPIIDLKARLNITPDDERPPAAERAAQRAKVIIVRGPKGPIGVHADGIIGVRRMPEADLSPAPAHIDEEEARFIEGVVISEGTFVTVLRAEEALTFKITGRVLPEVR
ncbi:MAG: purine-binding chemotaxis protein CheW [Nitrospirae bacterium]|nr:purine-binding chemotaxis protein CheW [Nitrospirota bacterium]